MNFHLEETIQFHLPASAAETILKRILVYVFGPLLNKMSFVLILCQALIVT